MLIPVILAGGTGTRLWPLSVNASPKQFLCLTDGHTPMLEQTVARLDGLSRSRHLIAVCNEAHHVTVAAQLQHAGISAPHMLLEPEGRNTAPAIALAAMEARSLDPDALLLVLPADHHIGNTRALHSAVRAGLPAAAAGSLVVFGVPPTRVETGYGYIRTDPTQSGPVRDVQEFIEKPDAHHAASYIAHGGYLWNSGMFLFRADAYLAALHQYAPDILTACDAAHKGSLREAAFVRPDRASFIGCRAESIDYAVMEHTDNAKVALLSADWSDVGSWDALQLVSKKDAAGNSLIGNVIGIDCSESYVRSESRLVAALGLRNHIVVETPDAVLVVDRDHTQAVRNVVEILRKDARGERSPRTRALFPWGTSEVLLETPQFEVSRLSVIPDGCITPASGDPCASRWTIVSGVASFVRDNTSVSLRAGQSIDIQAGPPFKLCNNSAGTLEIIRIQLRSPASRDFQAISPADPGDDHRGRAYHGARS